MRHVTAVHPHSTTGPVLAATLLLALAAAAALPAAPSLASPVCTVPDNGFGTGDLPPVGCAYDAAGDVFKIIDGLPLGSELHSTCLFQNFTGITRAPGGTLGGEIENYQMTMPWSMVGTGTLTGFNRLLSMQLTCETHSAPRMLAASTQPFGRDMIFLQGQLPFGDPDFDLLRITAGNGFGLPSPGHTTLVTVPGPAWNVDSFFDIIYRIDFVGNSTGPLAGRSGSTTGTIRMQCGQPIEPTNSAAGTWGRLKTLYR